MGIIHSLEPAFDTWIFTEPTLSFSYLFLICTHINTDVITSLTFCQHSVNSLLTWIGLGIGLNQLTLQLILGYVFYPLAFLIGIPRAELLPVARLLATKFVANELVAYTELQTLMKTDAALSARAYTITTYVLFSAWDPH